MSHEGENLEITCIDSSCSKVPVGSKIFLNGPMLNLHESDVNIVLFRNLDKWVRNRVRAYVRRRWRDRGRWKVYTVEELDRMGLARMEWKIPRCQQLKLFESPC
jgi:hypothetical protein